MIGYDADVDTFPDKSRCCHQITEMKRFLKPTLLVGLIIVILGVYWYGAVRQLEKVNTDVSSIDQGAYLHFAQKVSESGFTFTGGRNRMPAYSFLQALFLRSELSEEEAFRRGKYVNLVLSIILLVGIALIFHRFFDHLTTLNLVLITTFTVFIFKAGFFQSELLFYFLNFCFFLTAWQLLRKSSWKLAFLAGILAGLAHLTKASILPGLILFLIAAFAQKLWLVIKKPDAEPRTLKSIAASFLPTVLVAFFFLATIYPYINESKRNYGHYFYNVNSTFYIWYDSWGQAKEGTRAYGDRVGWPDMPAEEIPSMSKYFREHTLQQILDRLQNGTRRVMYGVLHSYGYFKYVVIYASLLAVAGIWQWRRAKRAFTSNPFLYLFLLSYFPAYFFLYFWYAPIADGNRLILAQFLPLMFTLTWGSTRLLREIRLQIGRSRIDVIATFNIAVLALLLIDLPGLITRTGEMYGGL